MRRGIGFVLLAALTTCTHGGESAQDRESWCSTLNEYAVMLNDVTGDPDEPVDPAATQATELEELIDRFAEMDVPDPIEADWEQALPRGEGSPEELHQPERVAAQVRSFEWIVDNCELSPEVDAEFRENVDSGREELGGFGPTSTSS